MISANQSFNMEPATVMHVPPCEGGEMTKEQQAVVGRCGEQQADIDWYRAKSKPVEKVLSAEQRRALVEKCPISQRNDTVSLMSPLPYARTLPYTHPSPLSSAKVVPPRHMRQFAPPLSLRIASVVTSQLVAHSNAPPSCLHKRTI